MLFSIYSTTFLYSYRIISYMICSYESNMCLGNFPIGFKSYTIPMQILWFKGGLIVLVSSYEVWTLRLNRTHISSPTDAWSKYWRKRQKLIKHQSLCPSWFTDIQGYMDDAKTILLQPAEVKNDSVQVVHHHVSDPTKRFTWPGHPILVCQASGEPDKTKWSPMRGQLKIKLA
jgi:hypothetical protein